MQRRARDGKGKKKKDPATEKPSAFLVIVPADSVTSAAPRESDRPTGLRGLWFTSRDNVLFSEPSVVVYLRREQTVGSTILLSKYHVLFRASACDKLRAGDSG